MAQACSGDSHCLNLDDRTPVSYSSRRVRKLEGISQIDRRQELSALLPSIEANSDLRALYPRSLWCHESASDRFIQEQAYLHSVVCGANPPNNLLIEDFVLYNSVTAEHNPGMFADPCVISLEIKLSTRKLSNKRFYLDGWVVHPLTLRKQYLTFMEIRDLSVGVFGDAYTTAGNTIWVQTVGTEPYACWYQLVRPAEEYIIIWKGFTWVSEFAMYLVTYLEHCFQIKSLVNLKIFRSQFLPFLRNHCADDLCASFEKWYSEIAACKDFGKHLVRHGMFLRSIASSVDHNGDLLSHPIWDDIGLAYIYPTSLPDKTVVTRYVAQGFHQAFPRWKNTDFDLLLPRNLNTNLATKRIAREQVLRLRPFAHHYQSPKRPLGKSFDVSTLRASNTTIKTVLLNKVISVLAKAKRSSDLASSPTAQSEATTRFAFVTGISGNNRMVKVKWLIEPADAILNMCRGSAGGSSGDTYSIYYPQENELYFSDECSCYTVPLISVQTVYEVSLFAIEGMGGESFCLSNRYRHHDKAVVKATMRDSMPFCRDSSCVRFRKELEVLIPPQIPASSKQNFPTIQNISLFSGCGLFDQGIEDGGNFRTISSLDNNINAIKSLQANRKTDGAHDIRYECINKWMRRLLDGRQYFTDNDEFTGAELMLTAGCSCCGWSLCNPVRQNKEGQRKCTLLASVISAVEVILPQYVLLENVPAMAQSPGCAQAVSLLLGLGYQVRVCVLGAHRYGGSTMRRRLFILAATPDRNLPDAPSPTHGEHLSQRMVTIRDAVGHLPPIGNDDFYNTLFPDHIPIHRWLTRSDIEISMRDVGRRIPKTPRGMDLHSSAHLLSERQKSWYHSLCAEKKSKSSAVFRRMHPDKQFNAVLTKVHSLDARGGATVHYDQDRTVTLEENRIAQGIPDDWILIGNLAEQQKQTGNAVPYVLGRAFGWAIDKSRSMACDSMLNISPGTTYDHTLPLQKPCADNHFGGSDKSSLKRSADVAFEEWATVGADNNKDEGTKTRQPKLAKVQHLQLRPKIQTNTSNTTNKRTFPSRNSWPKTNLGGETRASAIVDEDEMMNDCFVDDLHATNSSDTDDNETENENAVDNDNHSDGDNASASDSDIEYLGTRKIQQ